MLSERDGPLFRYRPVRCFRASQGDLLKNGGTDVFLATLTAEVTRGHSSVRLGSSSSLAPAAGEPGQPHAVADLRQGLRGGGLVQVRECGAELRPERERVKQLANPADRLCLAVCLVGAVEDLERLASR